MWLAGGGIKGGIVDGETDDFSYNVTESPCMFTTSTPPSSTASACSTKLTFRFQGRDFRPTGCGRKIGKGDLGIGL